MKKKIISKVLVGAMLLSALSSCGGTNQETASSPDASGSEQATSVSEDEKITISMWHVWPEANGGTAAAFAKTIEEVKEKYPEVEFEMDAVADSGDAYKTKIKTAVAGGEIPDIFYTWGGGFSEAFVKSGKVLNLDDYTTDETKEKMISGTLDFFEYDGSIYGYPLRSNVGVLFCNKAMFDEAGLEVPETFDELIQVCKDFNQKGIVPFAIGAKNPSDIAWWTDQLAQRTAGAEYVSEVLSGNSTFDTAEMEQSAVLFRELIDADAFDPGAAAISRDEAYTIFTSGINPMYFVGSWFCSNIMASEIADDVVVIPFPTVDGAKGVGTEFIGGADQTFMINSEVENPEKVVEIYTYMCERLSENVLLGGAGLPAWKTDADVSQIENKLLIDVNELYKNSTGGNIWWDNTLLAEPATNHMDTAVKLFLGEITPEEYTKLNTEYIN